MCGSKHFLDRDQRCNDMPRTFGLQMNNGSIGTYDCREFGAQRIRDNAVQADKQVLAIYMSARVDIDTLIARMNALLQPLATEYNVTLTIAPTVDAWKGGVVAQCTGSTYAVYGFYWWLVLIMRLVLSNSNAATIEELIDRKSTRLNSSHGYISYAVF